MRGLITDIQRFSLHDGPGIRTTVFCKGCNMRCTWCHNPETISHRPQLQFFETKCIGCGGCRPGSDTPHAAREDLFTSVDGQVRQYRGNCEARALVKVGRSVTPQDVLAEAMQDRRFYKNSQGGVTLSGGEVTMQPEFARETLTLLKAEGLHTAIETNLATPWSTLDKILPVLDLVMFDLKSMDDERHREWTGIGNQRILENARLLAQRDIPLVVRTPIIPGFNDTESDIAAVAEFIREFVRLSYYELLPFNPLGADKYRCLSLNNRMHDAPLIPGETMQRLQRVAARSGIEVRVA